MSVFLAVVLVAAPPKGPGEEDPPVLDEAFVRLRAGVWASRGFDFEAIRPGGLRVRSGDEVLASGGLDAGFSFLGSYVLFGTVEASGTDDVRAELAGLSLGYREFARPFDPPGVPDEVLVYAGGIWGRFDVDARGFGDFDDGFGFRAGLALTWRPVRSLALSLVAEYRLLEFDYEEPVVQGDREAGGSSGWVGLGLDLRF
jgi:hypothetical protein